MERVKKRPDGSPLIWVSHRHPIDQTHPVRRNEGTLFDTDHELWKSLDPGDCLAVFGCAQFGAWACSGECAILEFDEYFDPCVS